MCRNRNAKYGSRLNKVAATIWKPYTLEKYTRKQINSSQQIYGLPNPKQSIQMQIQQLNVCNAMLTKHRREK